MQYYGLAYLTSNCSRSSKLSVQDKVNYNSYELFAVSRSRRLYLDMHGCHLSSRSSKL